MIDPKTFVKNIKSSSNFKKISGTFSCSEPGCFLKTSEGRYDSENKKVYWTCPNGHDGSARLMYE